ncbi:hypothetical protein GGF43_005974, partial [Coemansia sp. RSA 2618]
NSVEDSMYYESHPGYSFMADTSAEGSSGTLGGYHAQGQQFELQSYPSMNADSMYQEADPYGAGYAYPTQQQQGSHGYADHEQQGAYEDYSQQAPPRQRPGGPRDYQ